MWPSYNGQLSNADISTEVLSLVPQKIMEQRFLMPLKFDEETGRITLVTSKYTDNFADIGIILKELCAANGSKILSIELLDTTYDNFSSGYNAHYKQNFTPSVVVEQVQIDTSKITSEQTKMADNILQQGITADASDIHITPTKDGPSKVEFRIDGKLYDAGIVLKQEDAVTICNIYKRNAGLDVNNLIGQDGRFTFLGRDFRLSTLPYGNDNISNKIVLRILGALDSVKDLDELSFSDDEVKALRKLIRKPSGILLVCGPTGEGKSTTLYSCLKEIRDRGRYAITTAEDPIEKYIHGISQTQVKEADNENASLTYEKIMRSNLRQDPDVIMVGEIRDKPTAVIAVQASQTGHFILSTLHVRNSISVFRRLNDMGANTAGFAEQIVGISSQRLLSVNCPHCKKKIVSEYNELLRKQDLEMLEKGVDDNGNEGYISYISTGCDECNHTGFKGRIPIIEIIEFDNYLRDYFAEKHGLIEIEQFLRKNSSFKSLWDKGMSHVSEGSVSLEELLETIEPDIELPPEQETEMCCSSQIPINAYTSKTDYGKYKNRNKRPR